MFGTPPSQHNALLHTLGGIAIAFFTAFVVIFLADKLFGYQRAPGELLRFLTAVAALTLGFAWWEQRRQAKS